MKPPEGGPRQPAPGVGPVAPNAPPLFPCGNRAEHLDFREVARPRNNFGAEVNDPRGELARRMDVFHLR